MERIAFNVEAKPRRMVAVDETKVKADGEWCYVWAAIDVDARELLAVWVSWYPDALQALGLKWEHRTFGMRNRIERWFRTMKAGTRRFSNNFPARKSRYSRSSYS